MTWKPTAETERWQAPAGLAPWRELTDDEHAALTEQHGDLSRWYERAPEVKKGKAARSAGGSD